MYAMRIVGKALLDGAMMSPRHCRISCPDRYWGELRHAENLGTALLIKASRLPHRARNIAKLVVGAITIFIPWQGF
jgi:hypothetical protein